MKTTLTKVRIAVLALAGGMAGLYGGAVAWEAMHLPRWVWNFEFLAYAQTTEQKIEDIESGGIRNKYELYLLNRRAVQDDILSYSVQIKSYQDSHQIAPNILVKALEDKQRDLERIESALAEMEQEK